MKEQISFKQYRRKQIAELADWVQGMDMTGVSISEADLSNGSPKQGDKIARNPKNHNDKWLVAADYFADNFEALSPQGDKIDGNALPSAAYDEYFTPPQGEGGRWVFKTDKLTPLQVKTCVCQQCQFPGELETKCDWCDNPKMMEFLRVAISAMEDFYQQHEANALDDLRFEIMEYLRRYVRQLISKHPEGNFTVGDMQDLAHMVGKEASMPENYMPQVVVLALKEQMERIFRAIEAEQSDYGKENEGYKALERVKLALKAELEGKDEK